MIEIVESIQQFRERRKQLTGKTIGFVPTMGNLHAGHQSLITRAKKENEYCVISIFVNPTQFNNETDLEKYPRSLEHDLVLAKEAGADMCLLPTFEQLYPCEYRFKIQESHMSSEMEGEHRPGHFDGVLTVVMKLLQCARADKAYFGEKDFQQYELIRDMCQAFFLETDIISCPTIRESSGLAMSSRNTRLTQDEKDKAARLAYWLMRDEPIETITSALQNEGFDVDYIVEKNNRLYGAVSLGDVRLIDNIEKAVSR